MSGPPGYGSGSATPSVVYAPPACGCFYNPRHILHTLGVCRITRSRHKCKFCVYTLTRQRKHLNHPHAHLPGVIAGGVTTPKVTRRCRNQTNNNSNTALKVKMRGSGSFASIYPSSKRLSTASLGTGQSIRPGHGGLQSKSNAQVLTIQRERRPHSIHLDTAVAELVERHELLSAANSALNNQHSVSVANLSRAEMSRTRNTLRQSGKKTSTDAKHRLVSGSVKPGRNIQSGENYIYYQLDFIQLAYA